MKLRLYNTPSGQLEEFNPLVPGQVGMYCCGLTVYFYAHIGNLRAYVNSDVLRRALERLGLRVTQVINVTDVGHMTSDEDAGEDKIEARAQKEGRTPGEIARFYENYFWRSLDLVNVLRPHLACRATEHIEDMIALIKRLEQRGYTYRTRVGVIYDTAKFPDYGKFARLKLEEQQAGFRVEVDPERRQPWDFALWVTNQPKHIMQWDSPWGRGFPGWHIECSAMSMKYLGEQFDIHTGGIDHVKVHHTNEIAQSEGATGKRFVNYWFHTQFLNVDGQKMSKSLGNLYTIDDVMQRGFHPLSIRYFFLGSSYRKPANFSWGALASAQTTLVRLWQKCADLASFRLNDPVTGSTPAFDDAIADDLNTAKALAVLLETVDARPKDVMAQLSAMDQVLGLDLGSAAGRLDELHKLQVRSTENEQKAKALAEKRSSLRQQKNYADADAIRLEIDALGFVVEDTPAGPRVKPKGPEV